METIWGDAMEDPAKIDDSTFGHAKEHRKPTFADKIKSTKPIPDIAIRAVKFCTPKSIQGPEIIKKFIEATKDRECLETMQTTHIFGQQLFWHAVLSKLDYVDTVCDALMAFPSMPEKKIQISPVRKRATLLTIPRVRPNITNEDIESQLCHFGSVQRIWNQTWKEFPKIANGNRLVTFLPSGGKEIPQFIICRGQKLVVSYKGRQTMSMRCNEQGHPTTECPMKNVKLCHLCASQEHQYRDCPRKDERERGKEMMEDKANDEEGERTDESETETVTGEDLVIDESLPPSTPEKTQEPYLPQLQHITTEIIKSSVKRTREETPPKHKTETAGPKPKRKTRRKRAQQSL